MRKVILSVFSSILLLVFFLNISAKEKEKIKPLDYYYLEEESSGRNHCLSLSDFFLWNDNMIVRSGEDFYYFYESSNELKRVKIDGIGKILDMGSHQDVPYVFGVDKEGYELRYKDKDEWIQKVLPEALEKSFEIDEFHLLSDRETLVLFSKYEVYIYKNGSWTEKKVPEIDFELGEYLPDRVSDEEINHAVLLDDTLFAGWDFGEWGGGVKTLNLKNDKLKWEDTIVKGSIIGLIKTRDRNVWAGMRDARLSDDKSESLFQYKDGKWRDYFKSVNYNKDEDLFLWMDFSDKGAFSLSEDGNLLITSSFLGVFKIVDEKIEQLVDWEGKLFNPDAAIEKDDTVFLSTRGGQIAQYGKDVRQRYCLNSKDDENEDILFEAIKKGDLEKVKKIKEEQYYKWTTRFINNAAFNGKNAIARYLIRRNNVVGRQKEKIYLSEMDVATIKELKKKGYEIKLSDISPPSKNEETRKYIYENVKVFDENSFEIDRVIKGSSDKERILFYINTGHDINYKNKFNISVLHETGSAETARILILLGANVNAMASPFLNHGETPLIVAARIGNFEMVKLLVESGAYVSLPDATGNTPLFYAHDERKRFYFPTMVASGLFSKEKENYEAIRKYLKNAEKKITKEEKEAVSNLVEKYRLKPKHAELLKAISENDLKKAEKAIKSMKDIRVKDIRKYSVLRAALSPSSYEIKDRRVILKKAEKCKYRNLEMLKMIAENSISRYGKVIDEYEVLDQLAFCDDLEAIKMLVEVGADVNAKNLYGWTVLNGILQNIENEQDYEIAKFLIIKGAKVDVIAGRESTLDRLGIPHERSNKYEFKLYEVIRSMGAKTLDEIRQEKRKKRIKKVKYK